ncbi:MAG: orotate phosphoribosyltransferase [Gemmatimonadales bacterium]|nr:orotate phosphoribosyltransferase [Gemmatimonadales bacterium]NIN10440.1 orotate phosphoribosyltransferase [Gemmatimonadales bacterium]NIN49232.1 orotate phosphoribosyltransferase [Gemmatimonadales bacterium]NIP06696.1 orotate phosphoribosyltransferase [Gemmatimonadales bacterium]NIR00027.1 orotate phosphoribosyltransferase [Gemmatimonadales bacterium]
MSTSREGPSAELAELIKTRSVQIGSFKLASGRRSSYYIDARRATMSAQGLELIGDLGLRAIRAAGWWPAYVGGLTLGADPVAHAIALASRRAPPELDAFTVRKEPKGHGTGQPIEGCLREGASVVVVEDVVTTGASALKAIKAVTRAKSHVLGVLAIVDREEGGREAIEAAGYSLQALLSLRDLGLPPQLPDATR